MTQESNPLSIIADRLADHLRLRPHLAERIHRELLMELHRREIVSIDAIHDEARNQAGEAIRDEQEDPNQLQRDRWDDQERVLVEEITRQYVCQHFNLADIDDLVNLAIKREEVHSLEHVASATKPTFRELSDKINRFCSLPLGETQLAPAEVVGTRVALTRHLVSDQLEYIGVAKNHLRIRDFDNITQRMIGSDIGMGRIGGKAGGMILANRILANPEEGKDLFLPIAVPESYFLRSDVVEDFIRLNRLDEYQNQKYKPIEDVAREYPLIRGVFRNGDFPLKIVHDLRRVLERLGKHPLIVRSSSLLEDRFGTAFCGKYASFFLANQGTLEQRLQALLGSIAQVYASTLGPDPIAYRREHNLIDYVEEMAVLIQRVVGVKFGQYFLPAFAGVAFSKNEYRWSPRIKREDGMMRMVMGLGTRAVDRSGADYPRMVALGAPTVRPESKIEDVVRCSQKTLDVIDLNKNRLRSIRFQDLLAMGMDFPLLDQIVSIHQAGELYAPASRLIDAQPSDLCITFDKLIRETPIVSRVQGMLKLLEQEYSSAVDMEFACDGTNFYVLQCRTQSQSRESGPVTIPKDIPEKDVLFDAHRHARTGLLEGLEYIVYVDPARYDAISTRQRRVEVARVVGRINRRLKPKSFVLVGPGRWGSNDIQLGVPVKYSDINHCSLLIEVARQKDGFVPEVSFGTHFFQDLIEANIHYLPLYPDESGTRYNEAFLNQSDNVLSRIVPDDKELEESIRVIHIPEVADGKTLTVAMDGETDQSLAYLV